MTATGVSKTGISGPMHGKTVLVTGATNGIGKVAARTLAEQGARVIIIGRNPEKTTQVASEIGAAGQIVADLSIMAEVRRAAKQFRDTEGQLDVLLNNAGGMFGKRQETPEGTEMTWALNHLSPFLLTHELLGLLTATPNARVVTVSSNAHRTAKIQWNDPEFRQGYSVWQAYCQSKLANILFTRELSRRLAASGVTANSLHPGVVSTGFGQNSDKSLGNQITLFYRLTRPLIKTSEQGAQTSIYLASSPDVAGVSGRYFNKEREAKPASLALDDGAAARLWKLSEAYVQQ